MISHELGVSNHSDRGMMEQKPSPPSKVPSMRLKRLAPGPRHFRRYGVASSRPPEVKAHTLRIMVTGSLELHGKVYLLQLCVSRRLALPPSCSIPPSAFEAAERRASAQGCSTSYSHGGDATSGTSCAIAGMPRRGFLLHAAGLLVAAGGLHARSAQVSFYNQHETPRRACTA